MSLDRRELLTSCPICHFSDFNYISDPDLCRCKSCDIVFRNPRPIQEDIIACYNKGSTFQLWQTEIAIRQKLWQKRLELVTSYAPKGSRLLDVGTGDGHFLDFAKNIYNVSATEISIHGVRYALARGHNVHHGVIFDSQFDDKRYDIITLWHVLEHVPDVHEVLNRLESLINPGGWIIIAVPNELLRLNSVHFSQQRKNPFGNLECDKEIHLIHFTPKTLVDILKSRFEIINFGVDDVHVHNRAWKLPFYYFNKLVKTIFNTHLDKAMYIVCRASA